VLQQAADACGEDLGHISIGGDAPSPRLALGGSAGSAGDVDTLGTGELVIIISISISISIISIISSFIIISSSSGGGSGGSGSSSSRLSWLRSR
jgi:hypothetical protein